MWACLTETEWTRLYMFQRGRCFICHTTLRNRYDPNDETRAIAGLDHSHAEEKSMLAAGVDPRAALRRSLRGLLCAFCNRNVVGIALRDDPEKARRAADYLSRPPARAILKLDAGD